MINPYKIIKRTGLIKAIKLRRAASGIHKSSTVSEIL